MKSTDPVARLKAINDYLKTKGLPPMPLPSTLGDKVHMRQVGGLRILGTERHDARRIDNQLRGRSGRQGDPGSSRFYLSLHDDLMKRFAGDRMAGLMRAMGLKDGIPIESRMVSNAVEKAQKRVEEYHYGIRKNLLEYDQVANVQRTIIYKQRQSVLEGKDLDAAITGFLNDALDDLVQRTAEDGTRGKELAVKLADAFEREFGLPRPEPEAIPVKDGGDACHKFLLPRITEALAERRAGLGQMHDAVLRFVMLDTIDRCWREHLYSMDHLRHAIGLESYAQKDPRLRYKEEGFRIFDLMRIRIRAEVSRIVFRVQLQSQEEEVPSPAQDLVAGGFTPAPVSKSPKAQPKGNDPCPCGSGRPFRSCHGI